MPMKDLLKELRDNQVFLSLEGNQLKLKFDQPNLPEGLIERIKLHKQAIIDYIKINQPSQTTFEVIMPRPASNVGYELSSAQKRMWVLGQFEDASLAYNLPNKVILNGDYDIKSLEKAIDAVIERHEILRTVFIENDNGEVLQQVLPKEGFDVKIDYRDFRAASNVDEQIDIYIKRDNERIFDLEKGPLLRLGLLQTNQQEYVFYYNLHHIISDGWSMGVLARDVLAYHAYFKSGEELKLPSLSIQYKDYAYWQQQQAKGENNQRDKDYWVEKLSGNLPNLNLPSAKKRPKIKTYNGLALSTYLSAEETDKLMSFSQQTEGSLFISLLVLWNVLLHRYTAQKDIIIGSPTAGRDHADLENQIGLYVNTIVFRNQIDPKQPFLEYYNQVKTNTLEAFNHQLYPFDFLLDDLSLKRDTSRSAIFDVLLVLQNMGDEADYFKIDTENSSKIESSDIIHARFDLEIIFQKLGPNLSFKIEFNTDVYDQNLIEGLMVHFKALLSTALEEPTQQIGKINFLSELELTTLLVGFNDNFEPYPAHKNLIDLFRQQVQTKPNAIALVFENRHLTYEELDRLSNQAAHFLIQEYEVQQGDLVGLMLPRNEWLLIMMIGILKAGAAYVPMDPNYPEARKTYIIEDTNSKVVIVESTILQFEQKYPTYPSTPPAIFIDPKELAYVIYTSGSTGTPKGVMIEHRNVTVFLQKIDHQLGFAHLETVAATTDVTFDISVLEIFGTLCLGKKLILFSNQVLTDPALFVQYIDDNKVEVLQITPSRLQQLERLIDMQESPLQRLIVGGEAFPISYYQKLKEHKRLKTVNVYGPTEATIWSTALEITNSEHLTIGSPLNNEQIYILNELGLPQPIGVAGEICIGGTGLARGYLNRPELTKGKFIENPIFRGKKLYRTGDLGSWTPNGNISFIGRKDDQVKIRGYRIELGEIEYYLQQQEDINKTVVLARKNKQVEKELIAYVIADKALHSNDLRAHLSAFLPQYMIPDYFVQLETLPLMVNGKVNKQALPQPDGIALSTGQSYVAPRNAIEEEIIQILMEELRRTEEEIGIHDNFFDLGANSIKLISILGKINKKFKVAIKPVQLFQYPNVSELVENVFYESADSQPIDQTDYANTFEDVMDLMED